MVRAWALSLLIAAIAISYGPIACGEPLVVELTVASDINPGTVSYLTRGLRAAERRDAALVLIKLDTPGGQMISTRLITEEILCSPVPIGVWVAPEGARAASAGTFIVYAAHVAGMAPSTNLGAAHPVFLQAMPDTGADKDSGPTAQQMATLEQKAVNDAVAQIRALAQRRGRNVEWAEKAVRESITATAQEAVKLGVVDFMASTAEEFADKTAGREVQLPSGKATAKTSGARIEPLPMNWRESLLSTIAHPNLAYILLIIGLYGIIFELKAPGFGGAGVAGIICLILGLYGLSVLTFSWAGLALILAGVGFLFAELYTPTHGVLAAGGLIAFVVGSLMLVNAPTMPISRPLIAGVAAGTGAFFIFALGAVVRSQKRPVTIGRGALPGRTGTARERLDPDGLVHVDGALWSATTDEGPIEAGEQIVVAEELAHMRVKVTKVEHSKPASDPASGPG